MLLGETRANWYVYWLMDYNNTNGKSQKVLN